MGPAFTKRYATLLVTGTTAIRIPMIKRGVVDFAVGADWTPASGDVKVLVDGTAAANITNLPSAVASGNGALWEFILTAAELTCKQCEVVIADSATKAVEDNAFIVETFGHASAMWQQDWQSEAFRRAIKGNVIFTVGSSSTTTSVITSSMTPAANVTDQFKGRILTFADDTTTAALRGQSTDITASSNAGVLTVTALTTAAVSGDYGVIT